MTRSDASVEIELSNVSAMSAEMPAADSWLNDDEKRRLVAMSSEQRRRQFLAGHWLLRRLAARIHGNEPSQWSLLATPSGSPSLRSTAPLSDRAVHASLSHCGDWLAAAIAPFPIGIDLEHSSKSRDLLALADATFSPGERSALRDLPENDRAATFYRFWTLKESVGKRAGHGLRPQLARRQKPVPSESEAADVISWQFGDVYLALAGEVGMRVRTSGLPVGSRPHYWRIESVSL